MEQLPKLRTILDLEGTELREVPSFSASLDQLLKMGRQEGERGKLYTPTQALECTTRPNPEYGQVRILLERLVRYAQEPLLSPEMLGAAVAMSGGRPGSLIIWAHTFAAFWLRTGKPVTIGNFLVTQMDGYLPSETGLHNLWNEQKVPYATLKQFRDTDRLAPDNWLDYPHAWHREVLAPVPAPS